MRVITLLLRNILIRRLWRWWVAQKSIKNSQVPRNIDLFFYAWSTPLGQPSSDESSSDLFVNFVPIFSLWLERLVDWLTSVLVITGFTGTMHFFFFCWKPRALGAKVLRVAMDRDGMIPSALREVMSHWKPQDSKNPESDIPRLLYIVPNGQNPTGSMLTLERRKEIYQVGFVDNSWLRERNQPSDVFTDCPRVWYAHPGRWSLLLQYVWWGDYLLTELSLYASSL